MSAPEVTQNDFMAFHAAHFGITSTEHFAQQFLGPVEDTYEAEVEDDGLGYYPDGVKRTLTDEQIAIFRHSEIQAILRERRHAAESNETIAEQTTSGNPNTDHVEVDEAEEEDGEVAQNFSHPDPIGPVRPKKKSKKELKKIRKAQEAKEKGWFKQNVKPDLRKRTWDKVEKSIGSLAYDDDEGGGNSHASSSAPQRRKVSYDDP
ncbi:7981a332-22b8-4973-a4f5-d614f8b44129 [Sclerotinia trifoliorum]|uniref:7981a332-22b8-4973-a4f5-d614f8b44129 n=1 Tax=Sclerotinia trifoliorum TaxID=28548 RepID=A0A8H2VNV7_9HELO|nr:7981a332-22b8-4973-a4f5-d614f8b44129 [Sclerotinia trifoliorum]